MEQASGGGGELGAFRDCPWVVPAWEEMIVDDWRELSTVEKLLLGFRLPLVLAQRATIPMTSQENYSRTWLVVSILFAPFFALLYFETHAAWPLLVSLLAGPLLSAVVARSTRGQPNPPRWALGTSWPIGTAAVALYGLVLGVFWIDLLAGELVGLLRCAGVLTGIPEAILGLTVLAWGNSVGDFFTNTSIAKAGKGNMALTACYAGPVFNMLIGLGLGFLSFFAKNHTHVAHVVPQRDVVLGCVFLLVHAVVVVAVGLTRGLRLPRWFGYFSIGWYVLYLVLAVALGVTLGPAADSAADQC